MDYSYTPVNRIINLNPNEKHTFNTKINLKQTNTYLYGFMLGNVNGTLLDDHNITISNVSLTGEPNVNYPNTVIPIKTSFCFMLLIKN